MRRAFKKFFRKQIEINRAIDGEIVEIDQVACKVKEKNKIEEELVVEIPKPTVHDSSTIQESQIDLLKEDQVQKFELPRANYREGYRLTILEEMEDIKRTVQWLERLREQEDNLVNNV